MADIITIGTTEVLTDADSNTAEVVNLLSGDTHEIIEGKVTKKVGVLVLTGAESWQASANGYSVAISGAEDGTIKSNRYTGSITNGMLEIVSDAASVDAFKAELLACPATGILTYVLYNLTTPTVSYVAGQDMTKKPVTVTASAVSDLTVTTTAANATITAFNLEGWRLVGATFNGQSLPSVIIRELATATPIRSIKAAGWHFSQLASLAEFFANNPNLTGIDFTNADVSGATTIAGLFANCDSLTTLNLTGLTLASSLNVEGLLGCTKDATLAAITMSNTAITVTGKLDGLIKNRELLTDFSKFTFNIAAVTSFEEAFAGCSNLTEVRLTGWANGVIDMSDCEDLTAASIHYLVTNADATNGKILVLDTLAKYNTYIAAYPEDAATITTNKITIAY